MVRRSLLLVMFAAASAGATEFAGGDVLIPVVGRGPGANGSEWRTDVVVTHVARRQIRPPETFTLTLSLHGQPEKTVVLPLLDPTGSLRLEDALPNIFGVFEGSGMLRIRASAPGARVAARARIYNVGSDAGEYGMSVPGVPIAQLGLVQLLPALRGSAGTRTNLGIANPGDSAAVVSIGLYEELTGELQGELTTVVPARSLWRWNDIFGPSGYSARTGATLRITTSTPVHAFASIVNAAGDSDYVSGIAVPIDAP